MLLLLPSVFPSKGTKLQSTKFKPQLTLRGQTAELCWLRRFPLLAMISSPADLTTARRPTQPLSHQPLLYRQQLQDKEVLLYTWLQPASCMMERVYDRGVGKGRWGVKAQQTTLTCPRSEDLGEPFSIAHSNSNWVIIIISQRGNAGPPDQRGIRVLQNVLCFIAFKSLIGQQRGPAMIRKPVMWKMKDLAYRTERWRREIIKYMTNVEPDCISCSNPCLAFQPSAALKNMRGKKEIIITNSANLTVSKKKHKSFSPHHMVYT